MILTELTERRCVNVLFFIRFKSNWESLGPGPASRERASANRKGVKERAREVWGRVTKTEITRRQRSFRATYGNEIRL